MHNPSEVHMSAVMRILLYLKSALRKGLMFSKHGHLRLQDIYFDWGAKGTRPARNSSLEFTTNHVPVQRRTDVGPTLLKCPFPLC